MDPRKRHIEKVLLKRSKLFPVLGLLGPRQVGKSTFLLNQWAQQKDAVYITFDRQESVVRAKRSPEQLLLSESMDLTRHLIIDEAQKVPHIFDSIKALVDQKRRMGAFTLSGSVEFSHKTGVRESLAGRMGILKLYPMTLRELHNGHFEAPFVTDNFDIKNPLNSKAIETWMERGGMPIFCGISDIDERIGVIKSWLEAIFYRDLKQLKDAEYDSATADNIMTAIATNPMIPVIQLATEFGATLASIKKHLSALESLFLIHQIPSFENPRAQSMYRIFDAGVLQAILGGQKTLYSNHASLITLVINEILAQYEYSGKLKPKIYYYRTRGGANIDIVLETKDRIIGIECSTKIDIPPYAQRGMKSFLKKYPKAKGYFIAPVQKAYSIDKNIRVIPWHSIG